MLENIIEPKTTMQADDVEEALGKEPPFFNGDMTFTNREIHSAELKIEPVVEDPYISSETATKFEGINLEDDIEKVEVTSQESSDEEAFSLCETPKSDLDFPLFSSIPSQSPSESIKSWLQRITDMQNEIQKKYNCTSPSTLTSIINNSPPLIHNNCTSLQSPNPSRVVKFQDLPYMGEMTLDNSKPRRGRKPKKADICHLIYKNYGTIFPGTPNPNHYLEKDNNNSILKKQTLFDNRDALSADVANRSDVQNRIISSLLEKRLTQEHKKTKETKKSTSKAKPDQNEPLNLCIRDLNHLKIRLLKNTDNTYTSEIKSEPHSDDDVEPIIKESPSPSLVSRLEPKLTSVTTDSQSTPSPEPSRSADGSAAPGGYVYWPNTGVFIHPVALQQQLMMYQRLASNNSYLVPNKQQSPKPPPPPQSSSSPRSEASSTELRKIVPRLVKPKAKDNIEETEATMVTSQDLKKRNATTENSKTPAKRKRSAIFIPPIPTENNTNPATEVSICKFKFTGGAKPTLQEKKMLSVDSGGNFRYYSGTGDKSMRGYEFFPRETLQQQINNSHGSSTGAFLQASGEKIYPTPPENFTGAQTSSEFLLSPDLPVPNFPKTHTMQDAATAQRIKKRKSRKSLQREKLEQTFKEKGFLIQTQQTESAEGATYCKFRQLRKFTRYLFRSWKDYLPGNIAEGDQPRLVKGEGELALSELSRDNLDTLSVHSSDMSSSNLPQ